MCMYMIYIYIYVCKCMYLSCIVNYLISCSSHWDTKMCAIFFLLELKKYARLGFWKKKRYGELWSPMVSQVIPTHSHFIARIFC